MNNKAMVRSRSQQPAKPAGSSNQRWWQSPMTWIVAVILAAGSIAVFAAASSNQSDSSSDGDQTAFAETLGTPLPPYATPDPAIGTEMPTISAQTLQGDRVELGADGTARLFGFFAHWCPHCQTELPATAQWLETNPLSPGVEVVAISTAVDPAAGNYPPSDWFAREEWPATVLLDGPESPLASAFGLTAFPFWVAVDADGLVVDRITGVMSEADFAALIAEITP